MNTKAKNLFKNKTVLITGGTGSFGKSFAAHLLKNYPLKKLIIFSRDEFKQYYMAKELVDPRIRFFIGDVRDLPRLETAFRGVDYVIHAAALKQVPTIEYNPLEAVKTNILGTQNVIEASIHEGVSRALLVSTDKSVLPINLYGATKLTAEKLFVSSNVYSPTGCRFSVVRYGNVLGSRGSIIEMLLKQPDMKKIQITDLTMTRFWLSLERSFRLVEFAMTNMVGGEVFVPKIPSMKLVDVFNALMPKAKREIIGLRPGEKLHEMLINSHESGRTIEIDDHYVILPDFPIAHKNFKKQYSKGKPVKKGFTLTSDGNENWLTEAEFIKLTK